MFWEKVTVPYSFKILGVQQKYIYEKNIGLPLYAYTGYIYVYTYTFTFIYGSLW